MQIETECGKTKKFSAHPAGQITLPLMRSFLQLP